MPVDKRMDYWIEQQVREALIVDPIKELCRRLLLAGITEKQLNRILNSEACNDLSDAMMVRVMNTFRDLSRDK